MAYPFGTASFYSKSRNAGAEPGAGRVVLVALNGDLMPSIFYQDKPLQRTRITLVPEHQPDAWEVPDAPAENFLRPLPALTRAVATPPSAQVRARLVRGEILRDEQGCLYENIAGTIRPLAQLFSGPRGEILEVAPSRPRRGDASDSAVDAQVTAEAAADRANTVDRRNESPQPGPNPKAPQAPATENAPAGNDEPAPYRTLFAEPGQRRVVRLGDFKAMLTPQLAHPERLRDGHRLACYLQLYEATRAQPLTALAAALGSGALVGQIQFLTEPVARVLGLGGLARPRSAIPANHRRPPGVILPHERVFRLRLAQDPTTDPPAADPARDRQSNGGRSTPDETSRVAPQRKSSIPERFIKPWEFKLTREEALYDMHAGPIFGGALSALVRRVIVWLGNRRKLRAWQLMLRGKNFDDQLWGMGPPKGALVHPKIRGWALKTLESAGYEPNAMLLEWEIFWRRKGV